MVAGQGSRDKSEFNHPMQYWLAVNKKAGKENNDGDVYWCEKLTAAGVDPIIPCGFDDLGWTQSVTVGDCIIAAGGDGSVNRAAAICRERDAILAILPTGTANDFARNLWLPSDPDQIARLIASMQWRWVDVAELNGLIFLNVAHIGLATLPARYVAPSSKQWLGRFSYAATLLKRLGAQRGFHASIQCDTGYLKGRWLSISVATGAFYGGGQQIPQASANDGQLDIVAVRPRSLLSLVTTFAIMRLLRRAPRKHSTVVHLKSSHCHIQTSNPKTVTADGEVFAKTPINVTCLPGSLAVVCEKIVET
jgi:YegS/Rv2252/BmrU family lipid kinase